VAVARRRPRLGDVVLAAVADGFRLHRLVWAPARGRWRIKADRAPTWDVALRDEDILATAVDVRTGTEARARGTRSAASWVRSLLAVAGAHLRALARPRSPI
jgi:phage gp46-like protein